MCGAGLRLNECLSLRVKDVDLCTMIVIVPYDPTWPALFMAVATGFLKYAVPSTRCLADLSLKDIEPYVAATLRHFGRSTRQQRIGYLRSFLRFCHDRGEVRAHLDAIDVPRKYRGERPPRAIAWDLAQRLLESIDRSSSLGERDYAVLYLMVHYGLRTGEIATLRLDSIDWDARELHVAQSKTRSALLLPLTASAAGVLKGYLHRGRPAPSVGSCSSPPWPRSVR